MPTPIDPTRLPGLKQALASFTEDDMASAKQLAELYGVAPSRFSTLTKTRFPEFPQAKKRGDKTHWYPARAAVQSMIAYMTGNTAKRQAQAVRHAAVMAGVDDARAQPAEQEPLTATELDKMASAQTRIWRLRREQEQFVRADEVLRVTRGAFAILTRELSNLPSAIDPNGELPPALRAILQRRSRDMVVKLNEALSAYLQDDTDVPTQRSIGTGSGSTGNKRRAPVSGRPRAMGDAA